MDKGSTFIRRKRKEEKFTRLPNEMLRNDNLTWKARGLLSYMLSMPDDWVFYETELVNHSKKDGLTALRTAFKELKEYGYVIKEPIRDELGKIVKWVTYVDDNPIQNTENPQCGKSTIKENHNVDNQTLLTTDSLITTKDTNNNIPPTKSKAKYDESSPYYQMAQYLYNKILDNNPNAKQPNYQKWSNDFRLIVERDKRDTKQLKEIIDFTQTDSFWKTAVFSPSSIRDKYDRFVVIISEKGKNKYNGNKEYQKQDAMSLMLDKFENGGFGNEPTNEQGSNGLFIPEDVGTL